MMNTLMLIGRVVKELQDDKIVIATNRTTKNENGEYETDFFPITLWQGIKEQVKEYCKKGCLVGIRGKLQTKDGEILIIAEKMTFLSSTKDNK